MTNKQVRREAAKKKAKRNKAIIIAVCAVIAVTVAAVVVWQVTKNIGSEVYSDGHAKIRLYADGSFKANLYHDDDVYKGTYTKNTENGTVTVTFVTNDGQTCDGAIINNALSIPHEWQDDHGHESALPKR